MIGALNHIAIAVPDLKAAVAQYQNGLGAKVSPPQTLPDHGVRVVFVTLPNTKIELLEPLEAETTGGILSPITAFLERNPKGGIHHVCYEVEDIKAACVQLSAQGVRILGDEHPKTGAHGKPVIFLHPSDLCGTLIELEQR